MHWTLKKVMAQSSWSKECEVSLISSPYYLALTSFFYSKCREQCHSSSNEHCSLKGQASCVFRLLKFREADSSCWWESSLGISAVTSVSELSWNHMVNVVEVDIITCVWIRWCPKSLCASNNFHASNCSIWKQPRFFTELLSRPIGTSMQSACFKFEIIYCPWVYIFCEISSRFEIEVMIIISYVFPLEM